MIEGVPTINFDNTVSSEPYIIKELHVTELEKFMKCPYQYKFDNEIPSENSQAAFYEGDITEQLMTNYLYGEKLGDEALIHFMESTEFPKLNRLKTHVKNWKKYISENPERAEKYPLFTQKRMTLCILKYPYMIKLSGTADRVFSDLEIADCKTSKNKWREQDLDRKLQWKIYPRMLKTISNHPKLKEKNTFKFSYVVFTKQATPQLQVLTKEGNYTESEALLKYLINEYVKDEWEPKKSLQCRWCSIKSQCPLYIIKETRF